MVVWLADPSSDMVVYAYAFRSHWFWLNNYGQYSQSFVVWKDFKCSGTPRVISESAWS